MENSDYNFERPLLNTLYSQCRTTPTSPPLYTFVSSSHVYPSLEKAGPWGQTTRQTRSPRLQYQVKAGCVCACANMHTSAAAKHLDMNHHTAAVANQIPKPCCTSYMFWYALTIISTLQLNKDHTNRV